MNGVKTEQNTWSNNRKTARAQVLRGVVVSTKMKDTAVVEVQSFTKHPKYRKFIRRSKRYKAHDVGNTREVGQTVEIVSCRPISKDKRFKIAASTVPKATEADEALEASEA